VYYRCQTDPILALDVLSRSRESGEYIAVEPGAGGGNQILYDLWGAFMQ